MIMDIIETCQINPLTAKFLTAILNYFYIYFYYNHMNY